jgi:hypothetical protein
MSFSINAQVGTDTGEASYAASGTVTNSANITTAIGDAVFVFHSYDPASFALISCTLSGGTGAYTSGSGIASTFGNVASQPFYRIATAAETFKVTTTLATSAANRRIFVAVLRSSTGTVNFSANISPSVCFDPPSFPGANSLSAQSVPNNSIIISGLSSQGAAPVFVAGSGYTLISTSDSDVAIYQTNTSATSTTPSFTNSATASRVRAAGFIFYDSPAAFTPTDTASFSRGIGRGIARGIA